MIAKVSVRNFVLIRRLEFSPAEGFLALTGQTGAGKSLLLHAIALALGAPADRSLICPGAEEAEVAVSFAVGPGHPVRPLLAARGVCISPGSEITIRRMIRRRGGARSFINDKAVCAALLSEAGEELAEIHGQHAVSALMRPSAHRRLLDQFAGNEGLLARCGAAWHALQEARTERRRLDGGSQPAGAMRAWLVQAVEDLERLAPRIGEAEELAEAHVRLLQARRFAECVTGIHAILGQEGGIEAALVRARRGSEGLLTMAGPECPDNRKAVTARMAQEAMERALMEVREAEGFLSSLMENADDPEDLERQERRLSALRSAARRYEVGIEGLPSKLVELRDCLEQAEAADANRARAQAELERSEVAWRIAARRLSEARREAAGGLAEAIMAELEPLCLGRMVIRVAFSSLPEPLQGAEGDESVEFEVETGPGAGFGPLRRVASGGELARVCLAIKCALAKAGNAATLIFDEADQGVGGAVAAAIGSCLERLSATRQVIAVTHSPQVAAAADHHWVVEKAGETRFALLDAAGRREEIARMLSGVSISDEARAAADRLMEDSWAR